ncbi:hypothetical protein TNCV_2601961 [Trichonephila clavipes]|nr:hypothetical protein TNCV_2601961 [Trichonephila clavipes]
MFPSSSFVNPTPLAHADTPRDILPRWGISQNMWSYVILLEKNIGYSPKDGDSYRPHVLLSRPRGAVVPSSTYC